MPNYSKQELKDWILTQPNYKDVIDNWRANNHTRNSSPSVDRKDDYLPYTLNNLKQFMSWGEHNKKSRADRKNGINNKHSKAVVGTNIKTGEIVEFYSMHEAERRLGISSSLISGVCIGKKQKKGKNKNGETRYSIPKSAGGYKWEYKN